MYASDAAPHADVINKFITPKAVITTSTEDGDLVYGELRPVLCVHMEII